MHQTKYALTSIFALGLILFCSIFVAAQQVEPSYDVTLQLVIGSDDNAQRSDLPPELSNVSRQLKSSFKFSNYRLASTFLGRISNNGSFEYKSTSNIFGQEVTSPTQSFIEWSAISLKAMPNAKGQSGFQAQTFRFGARVPVLMSNSKDESGKSFPVYNYEQIGLTLSKIGLSENVPTLVGTLTLPVTSGTIFLIMTVKSAD